MTDMSKDYDKFHEVPQFTVTEDPIEPVGVRNASEGCPQLQRRQKRTIAGETVEPAEHNQTTLPQRSSEVVNLTGLAEYKGLNVCVEGNLFAVNESSRAVDLIADVKEWTWVHSSLVVSSP